jgi:hypothetical protein
VTIAKAYGIVAFPLHRPGARMNKMLSAVSIASCVLGVAVAAVGSGYAPEDARSFSRWSWMLLGAGTVFWIASLLWPNRAHKTPHRTGRRASDRPR